MSDSVVVQPEGAQLSQVMRVVDAFVSPTKTFTDILRSTSCWLPIVMIVVLSLGYAFTVQKVVGFESVAEQQLAKTPAIAEQMQQMPAADREHAMRQRVVGTRFVSYIFFVFILVILLIEALVLWASFNFGLGAKTKFSQVFAVILFAGLPRVFVTLLAIGLLFAGVGVDSFDMQNPVGTNLGYYLTSPGLKAAGSFFDVFGLWSLALLIFGMAIISRKSKGQSAAIILGWWLLLMLGSAGVAAAFG